MARSRFSFFMPLDFVATSGSPNISTTQFRVTGEDQIASPVYVKKNRGSDIRIVRKFDNGEANVFFDVEGRMSQQGSWRDITATDAGGVLTVLQANCMPEMRLKLSFDVTFTYVITEPFCFGEV